jgi:hypothetical protein
MRMQYLAQTYCSHTPYKTGVMDLFIRYNQEQARPSLRSLLEPAPADRQLQVEDRKLGGEG